ARSGGGAAAPLRLAPGRRGPELAGPVRTRTRSRPRDRRPPAGGRRPRGPPPVARRPPQRLDRDDPPCRRGGPPLARRPPGHGPVAIPVPAGTARRGPGLPADRTRLG